MSKRKWTIYLDKDLIESIQIASIRQKMSYSEFIADKLKDHV